MELKLQIQLNGLYDFSFHSSSKTHTYVQQNMREWWHHRERRKINESHAEKATWVMKRFDNKNPRNEIDFNLFFLLPLADAATLKKFQFCTTILHFTFCTSSSSSSISLISNIMSINLCIFCRDHLNVFIRIYLN